MDNVSCESKIKSFKDTLNFAKILIAVKMADDRFEFMTNEEHRDLAQAIMKVKDTPELIKDTIESFDLPYYDTYLGELNFEEHITSILGFRV